MHSNDARMHKAIIHSGVPNSLSPSNVYLEFSLGSPRRRSPLKIKFCVAILCGLGQTTSWKLDLILQLAINVFLPII